MTYQAIILAAGRGSRMGNETALKPKCLTPLAGRTLLEWQKEAIHAAGIQQILVVTGYRADMLQGTHRTVNNDRWSETNMVASLFCAPPSEQSRIVSYSDIAYHPDHLRQLQSTPGDIVITADLLWEDLWTIRMDDPLEDAETFKTENGKLQEIGQKPLRISDVEAQYMGLLKITPAGWATMKELFDQLTPERQDKMDMTTMLNELLTNGESINVAFVRGKWCEADTYEDILAYERQLEQTTKWAHDWR